MTPDKRLNQIEPILADVAQKVDRLIEGNGRIIAEVSKLPGIEKQVSKLPDIERAVSITAKGLADLTTNVNRRFDQQQGQIDDLREGMNLQFTEVNQRFDQLQQSTDQRFDQLQQSTDQRFDQLQQGTDQQFDQLQHGTDQRFDQLQRDVDDVKSTQQLILQILRDKLG